MSADSSPISRVLASRDARFTHLVGISSLDPTSDLQNLNLDGIRIGPGESVAGYDFSHCLLRGADFTGADLTGAIFAYCDLTGANLIGAIFTEDQFAGVDLQRVRMEHSSGNVLLQAQKFLSEVLFEPVERDPATPKRLRTLVSRTKSKVYQFRRIGDLVSYVGRFSRNKDDQIPLSLEYKNNTMEDVHSEFFAKFGSFANECSTTHDLIIGSRYSVFFISSLAQIYTNRGGGIHVVGKVGEHTAVLVRATMQGGERPNRWMQIGVRMQYCLKPNKVGDRTVFNDRLPENRAISDYPDVPIHVFARANAAERGYIYYGIFKNAGIRGCRDEPRWFDLVKFDHADLSNSAQGD
jgi:hypothetical protein